MHLWEAIKALKNGKKVRDTSWFHDEYLFANESNDIVAQDGQIYRLSSSDYRAEWEIYEEPLTEKLVLEAEKLTEFERNILTRLAQRMRDNLPDCQKDCDGEIKINYQDPEKCVLVQNARWKDCEFDADKWIEENLLFKRVSREEVEKDYPRKTKTCHPFPDTLSGKTTLDQTYNFMEAVQLMKEGRKVRRKEWINKWLAHSYDYIFEVRVNSDKFSVRYLCHLCDLEATDWVVVDE